MMAKKKGKKAATKKPARRSGKTHELGRYQADLPVPLTDAEKQKLGEDLARLEGDLLEFNRRLVNARAALKDEEKEIRGDIQATAALLRAGKEMRQVEVVVEQIDSDNVRETRTDTGAVVRERPMTPDEKQRGLFDPSAVPLGPVIEETIKATEQAAAAAPATPGDDEDAEPALAEDEEE